ncbi:MAG: SDR family NAD(P)-dependent oxidoreductase [bacterium]|nr:SDR family NAD(P)-dependent oxidoreductase [bacterium]
MSEFENKTALITGASRGIGKSVSVELARLGCHLILCSRSKADLLQVKAEIQKVSPNCNITLLALDLNKPETIAEALAPIKAPIHFLVNNAGNIMPNHIQNVTETEWDTQLDVNLKAPFFLIKHVIKKMPKGGAIVNVSSLSGIRSMPKFPALSVYCASKAGLIGMTEALAAEFKPLGVRINAIAPGAVNTQLLNTAFPDYSASTQPNDIAYPIINLLNPVSSNKVTGATLEVLCND